MSKIRKISLQSGLEHMTTCMIDELIITVVHGLLYLLFLKEISKIYVPSRFNYKNYLGRKVQVVVDRWEQNADPFEQKQFLWLWYIMYGARQHWPTYWKIGRTRSKKKLLVIF